MWGLRVSTPKRSMWRVAQFDTLRLRLIKISARVVEMKTMIRVHLPTSCPAQDILRLALQRIPRLVPERRGARPQDHSQFLFQPANPLQPKLWPKPERNRCAQTRPKSPKYPETPEPLAKRLKNSV